MEGQPFSQQATKYLAGLILNKVVDIKGYGMDGYGRVLGVITVGGKNVNLEMVKLDTLRSTGGSLHMGLTSRST